MPQAKTMTDHWRSILHLFFCRAFQLPFQVLNNQIIFLLKMCQSSNKIYEDLKNPKLFYLDFFMKMLIFFTGLYKLLPELSGLLIQNIFISGWIKTEELSLNDQQVILFTSKQVPLQEMANFLILTP